MDLFAVGCGGILYPPHMFSTEVFHVDHIKKYCKYADDVWLKVMELISGISVVQVPSRFLDRADEGFAQDGLFQQHNGNDGNDKSLRQLLKKYNHFPDTSESLIEKMFSTGIVCEKEIKEGRRKDNIKMLEEYIACINEEMDIVIYGAGTVAKRVYNALKHYGIDSKIRAFAVEDTDINISDVEGVNVVQYKEVDYINAVCIIAVSNLVEQYRIFGQLLSCGLEESQVFFLNYGVLGGLRDIESNLE